MEAKVFERMAEHDATHWWFVARRQILETVIKRVVRPPAHARILEIGCGTGHNLDMLSKFGRVEATELDDSARAIATKRLGQPVVDAALPDLSRWPEQTFDMVALLDVLEHVPDDHSALEAIRGRLKPGGALLVTVPANKWMWSAHDVVHHHHRRYGRGELAAAAKRAGFDAQMISHFNTLLFPLVAAARLAGKVTGRETSDDVEPPAPLNGVLRGLFGLESALIGRVPMPFGVSLLAVLRPKG